MDSEHILNKLLFPGNCYFWETLIFQNNTPRGLIFPGSVVRLFHGYSYSLWTRIYNLSGQKLVDITYFYSTEYDLMALHGKPNPPWPRVMTKVKNDILIGLIFWISKNLLFPRNYYFLEISILNILQIHCFRDVCFPDAVFPD